MLGSSEDEFDRLVTALARKIVPIVRREFGSRADSAAAIQGLFTAIGAAEVDLATARSHAEFLYEELIGLTPEPPQ